MALVSYTEGMRQQGVVPGRSPVIVEHLPADEQLAAELGVETGAVVLHLERVLTADGDIRSEVF